MRKGWSRFWLVGAAALLGVLLGVESVRAGGDGGGDFGVRALNEHETAAVAREVAAALRKRMEVGKGGEEGMRIVAEGRRVENDGGAMEAGFVGGGFERKLGGELAGVERESVGVSRVGAGIWSGGGPP